MTDQRIPIKPHVAEPDPDAVRAAARDTYEATAGKVVLINMDWLPTYKERVELDRLAARALGLERGKLCKR